MGAIGSAGSAQNNAVQQTQAAQQAQARRADRDGEQENGTAETTPAKPGQVRGGRLNILV